MELWIRNQDKENIIKVDALEISKEECDEEIIYEVVTFYSDKLIVLGCYKTKERALEVLDEIQENIIKQGQLITLTDEKGIPNGSKFFSYVYEMPKE